MTMVVKCGKALVKATRCIVLGKTIQVSLTLFHDNSTCPTGTLIFIKVNNPKAVDDQARLARLSFVTCFNEDKYSPTINTKSSLGNVFMLRKIPCGLCFQISQQLKPSFSQAHASWL